MTIANYISSTAGCGCNAKDLELDSGDGVERGADRRRSVDFLRRVGIEGANIYLYVNITFL
jgi:hypothetical protein